jgi:hypothetical protein
MIPDFSKARWRKSSVSDSGGCVEVAYADGWIGVRDTKHGGASPVLTFTEREWTAFAVGVELGEFTLDELSR